MFDNGRRASSCNNRDHEKRGFSEARAICHIYLPFTNDDVVCRLCLDEGKRCSIHFWEISTPKLSRLMGLSTLAALGISLVDEAV